MTVALSLVAAGVAAALSTRLGRDYAARRRHHALAWCLSLALFAVASAAVAVGVAAGWPTPVFAVFWATGALVTVPVLAAGQLMFMDPPRARLYWALVGLVVVLATAAMAVSPMDAEALAEAGARRAIPAGEDVFGDSLTMALLPPFNYTALVVVGGVLWSAVTTRRWTLTLIAAGVVVAGGSFAFVRAGSPEAFSTTLAVGVVLMYAGFRAAARPHAGPARSRRTRGGQGTAGGGTAGPPPRRRRPTITVYTRQGCGLCRTAERHVVDVAGDEADVEFVDVDADPELYERYTVRVPVVAVDGEERFEFEVDPEDLAAALRAAARG